MTVGSSRRWRPAATTTSRLLVLPLCWKPIDTRGFAYADASGTPGVAMRVTVQLKAKSD